jgi:hypothetical protein
MKILPKIEKKDVNEASHILLYFSSCMYNIVDKEAFQEAFNIMRNKVEKKQASWLDSLYKFKENGLNVT